MSDKPRLSIVLPCYNEAQGIPKILQRFATVGKGYDFELILVDNGSRDDTQAVLAKELPVYPFARSVQIVDNKGYGDGIFTGLKEARGELLAWSHADLQTDPADVFRALDYYQAQGASAAATLLVKGRRHGRRLSERIISWGMQVAALFCLRRWIPEINAQPKLFHCRLLEHLPHPPIDFNLDVYVLYQARRHGWRLASIDVPFPPRQYGKSNWAATWRSKIRTTWRSMRYMFLLGLGLR
jgi:glycosyltransferase involved in cell wall biosynthesis